MNYDVTWNIFDVLSKIRMAFFRSLLESLRGNDGAVKDEFPLHKPFSFKPTAINLIGNTIKELKSIPNDKGYMLIAVVPRSEGAAAVDLLQREVIIVLLSIKTDRSDTLNSLEKYKTSVYI